MDNIFKSAYFGKPYKTRDERKALYLGDNTCWIEGEDHEHGFSQNGKFGVLETTECGVDIVSEWKEKINEEKPDSLAKQTIIYVYDRLNKKIHECKITELKGEWVYYNFNGEDCAHWLNGGTVAPKNIPFKPYNYKFLVSLDYKSLMIIKESDEEIYNIFNQALKDQCNKILLM